MKKQQDIIIELDEKSAKFAFFNNERPDIYLERFPFDRFTLMFPCSALMSGSIDNSVNIQDIISYSKNMGLNISTEKALQIYNETVNRFNFLDVKVESSQMIFSYQDVDRVSILDYKIEYGSPEPVILQTYNNAAIFNGDNSKDQLKILTSGLALMALNVICYIVQPKEKVLDTRDNFHKDVKPTTKKICSGNSSKNTKIYVSKKVYVVQDIEKIRNSSTEKKNFNRKTSCWGVIGHFREYQSGKKVWIKPYTKGNKNDSPAQKHYKITKMEQDKLS